jgi:hypothetical protein
MAKERVLRTGAHMLAAFLLALPATQASFAEDVQPRGHDSALQSEAGRTGDSTPALSDQPTGGATTPDQHTPQKAAGTPGKTDTNASPNNANPAVTPQDTRGRGGGSQSAGAEKADVSLGAKSSPAPNVPAKGLGPADTHLVVPPLPRSTGTPDKARSGSKTFKIVTPDRSRPLRPPAGAETIVRNAIGQTVASHEVITGRAGAPFSRPAPHSPAGGAASTGNAVGTNRGAARVAEPNSTSSVTGPGLRGAIGAGPNHSGTVLSGIGGPAKMAAGINGTTQPPKH